MQPIQEPLLDQPHSPPRILPSGRWLLALWSGLLGAGIIVVVALHYTDGATTASISTGRCQCDDFSCKMNGRTVQCGTFGQERTCCIEKSFQINDEVTACSADGRLCLHPVVSSALTGLLTGCFLLVWSVGLCCYNRACWPCCWTQRGHVLAYQQHPQQLSMQPLNRQPQQQYLLHVQQ
jgi:hypothetical protein